MGLEPASRTKSSTWARARRVEDGAERARPVGRHGGEQAVDQLGVHQIGEGAFAGLAREGCLEGVGGEVPRRQAAGDARVLAHLALERCHPRAQLTRQQAPRLAVLGLEEHVDLEHGEALIFRAADVPHQGVVLALVDHLAVDVEREQRRDGQRQEHPRAQGERPRRASGGAEHSAHQAVHARRVGEALLEARVGGERQEGRHEEHGGEPGEQHRGAGQHAKVHDDADAGHHHGEEADGGGDGGAEAGDGEVAERARDGARPLLAATTTTARLGQQVGAVGDADHQEQDRDDGGERRQRPAREEHAHQGEQVGGRDGEEHGEGLPGAAIEGVEQREAHQDGGGDKQRLVLLEQDQVAGAQHRQPRQGQALAPGLHGLEPLGDALVGGGAPGLGVLGRRQGAKDREGAQRTVDDEAAVEGVGAHGLKGRAQGSGVAPIVEQGPLGGHACGVHHQALAGAHVGDVGEAGLAKEPRDLVEHLKLGRVEAVLASVEEGRHLCVFGGEGLLEAVVGGARRVVSREELLHREVGPHLQGEGRAGEQHQRPGGDHGAAVFHNPGEEALDHGTPSQRTPWLRASATGKPAVATRANCSASGRSFALLEVGRHA